MDEKFKKEDITGEGATDDEFDFEEDMEHEAVGMLIKRMIEAGEAIPGSDEKTTVQVTKKLKKQLEDLKEIFESHSGVKVSFNEVLTVILHVAGGKSPGEIVKVVRSDGVKSLLKGTVNAAHKCEYKIGLLKKMIEKTLPTPLLNEWVDCICQKSREVVSLFKSLKSANPHCYSDDDITLLLTLMEQWIEKSEIKKHVGKKVEKYAVYYMAYSDLFRKITTNIIKTDVGEICEATGIMPVESKEEEVKTT